MIQYLSELSRIWSDFFTLLPNCSMWFVIPHYGYKHVFLPFAAKECQIVAFADVKSRGTNRRKVPDLLRHVYVCLRISYLLVSSDVFIITLLRLFIPADTTAMPLKDIINIYLAVLVLNLILPHIVLYFHNANSIQFNSICLRTTHATLSFRMHTFLKIV